MLAAEAVGCSEQRTGERFSVLTWEQVQRLDQILGETVPIHGRGNFPTLSVKPRTIVQVRTGRRWGAFGLLPRSRGVGDGGGGGGGGGVGGAPHCAPGGSPPPPPSVCPARGAAPGPHGALVPIPEFCWFNHKVITVFNIKLTA